MDVNSLACIRVKGGESEYLRIESGVREDWVMSPLPLQCVYGCSDERSKK